MFPARIYILLLVCLHAVVAAKILPNFPFYRQNTEFNCGCASLQMALKYITGNTINQEEICNAARTTADQGTWSFDLLRAHSYSAMSSPMGTTFAANLQNATQGYTGSPMGVLSFLHQATQPWLDELRLLIDNDHPVIVLQAYSDTDRGGHYRVVYGYNETHFLLMDPWDRDNQPRSWEVTIAEFNNVWNYSEPSTGSRYVGMVGVPLQLRLDRAATAQGFFVKAAARVPSDISLRVFGNAANFSQWNLQAQIVDPIPWNRTQAVSKSHIWQPPGQISPDYYGDWVYQCRDGSGCQDVRIRVTAAGFLQGAQPQAPADYGFAYPAYTWMDRIGVSIVI